MAESAEKMVHELTQAGLLSSDQVTKYGEEIDTGADALLTKLVTDGHITSYQAEKFRDGKASDIYFGDYIVLDKLGQGGMGTVLLARHRVMDRKVAIKVLPVTVMESKDAVARFYQEVKVAAQLKHENIVHAYDAREHHGYHYLVMEYVQGHDLAQVLQQLGPIPASMAIDYISQAANGLDYAHRKEIVHRDIKPSNLLLDDEGKIKILDMGLARIGSAMDQETQNLTTTGQVMGTVEYMSPEQAEDTRQADARSDIYSLGCTLYRLLTGKGPFSRETVVKTILAHRDAAIPVIETGMPEDKAINQLFQKMVAKNPNDRFQTSGQLVEAIKKIEEGQSQIFTAPPILQPKTAPEKTAVAERFDSRSLREAIPEAIIPGDQPPSISYPDTPAAQPEIISDDSVVSVTTGYGQQSEVLYIPDIAPPKNPIARANAWMKKSRSHSLMVWAIASCCLIPAPVIGFLMGWFTWRGANQDIREIADGKRTPVGFWMSKTAKILAMIATFLGLMTTIAGFVIAVSS